MLHEFVRQVRSVWPDASGAAITIVASAQTIVDAFAVAAASALGAIALILFVFLRRLSHMLLVLSPLVLSALLTVILVVAIPEPLNFANIIALPLLLGVGVSFNIYFVMNWRRGWTGRWARPPRGRCCSRRSPPAPRSARWPPRTTPAPPAWVACCCSAWPAPWSPP